MSCGAAAACKKAIASIVQNQKSTIEEENISLMCYTSLEESGPI
jgi:hypothetical protein